MENSPEPSVGAQFSGLVFPYYTRNTVQDISIFEAAHFISEQVCATDRYKLTVELKCDVYIITS